MSKTQHTSKPSGQFWLLALFVSVVFATGGASRSDVQSLAILRPLSVMVSGIACLTLLPEHLVKRRWLIWCATTIFALAFIHLISLPFTPVHLLGWRPDPIAVQILGGISDDWLPLTLNPTNGWNAFASLITPLAVILLGIQLNREDLFRLLPLIIALATLSGLFGLLQVVSGPQGPLYFYNITNNGSAVGLFANRNHSATLLSWLFPMLAVYAATAEGKHDTVQARKWTAAVVALVLIPLILVTGSRSGLLGSVIGLGAAVLLYGSPYKKRIPGNRNGIKALPLAWGVGVIGLAFLTYFLSRAEAFERLFAESAADNSRTDFWTVSLDLFWKFFPWGSGSGSFALAAQRIEPIRLLDPTYLNRAHNDFVETAATFGLPGVAILLIIIIGCGVRSYRLWFKADVSKRSVIFGRLASVLLALIAIASASDYPLRTPTMMILVAICFLWLTEASQHKSSISANREINPGRSPR